MFVPKVSALAPHRVQQVGRRPLCQPIARIRSSLESEKVERAESLKTLLTDPESLSLVFAEVATVLSSLRGVVISLAQLFRSPVAGRGGGD